MNAPDDSGWWISVPQICADLLIGENDWQEWRQKGETPEQVTGPDGIDRVHRADYEAWIDFLAVKEPDPEDGDR